MESVDKLKPCPFCGGEAMVIGGADGGYAAYCPECNGEGHCEVGWFFTAEEAAEAWNTRVERTCRFIDDSDGEFPPKCSACGYEPSVYECSWLGDGGYEFEGNYCPSCGRKVKR